MTSEQDRGGPSEEFNLDTPGGKPALIICPECGAENIQGTDYCVNCNSDLRTLDIPPETWSPGIGPPGPHVGRIGSHEAIEVPTNARVRDVVAKLRDEGYGCAVVTDNGRVVGIFTERDVLNRITPNRASAMDMPVAEAMTADPVLLSDSESVLVAINKMGVGGFRHIPLVDERRHVRGIISGRDIMEYVERLVGDG